MIGFKGHIGVFLVVCHATRNSRAHVEDLAQRKTRLASSVGMVSFACAHVYNPRVYNRLYNNIAASRGEDAPYQKEKVTICHDAQHCSSDILCRLGSVDAG